MKIGTTAILLFLGLVPAHAEPINLTCGGKFYQYEPDRIEGSVAPASSMVDLEARLLKTPMGTYRIVKAEDNSINFEGKMTETASGDLLAMGWLDRTTGRLTTFFYRPEQMQLMKSGQKARATMYMELNCAASKRLF